MEETYWRHSLGWKILTTLAKTILIIFLILLFFVIGLFIGYTMIGDGNFWEVLNRDTWLHIVRFIQ